MFRRLFRVTFKLALIAGIGFGIAVVVKKLTAPPDGTSAPLEPWPPLDERVSNAGASAGETVEAAVSATERSNGESGAGSGQTNKSAT